jgi:DNA-binding response OmpR family regulator
MRRSILLADDSATIRRVVEITFSDSDFHVETVASGTEALSRLDELRPDLVLADVVMPEPTGYEICRRIKASDRPVPVLLLAGTFEAFDHDEARACGADGCLLKPFESRTLLDRVTSLLANRDAVTGAAVEPVEVAPEQEEAEQAAVEEPVEVAPSEGLSEDPDERSEVVRADPAEELPCGLEPEAIDAIARAVVHRLSDDVVREIAHEVVPRVAEAVVRQRIRELEDEDS